MSVNLLSIEQSYQLIASLHAQATGKTAATPINNSDFISVAQATLTAGKDQVLNSIMQMVQKTLIAVRPYEQKFGGLVVTNERWGGIIRKISFADKNPQISENINLTDGVAVDQYVVNKPVVLETHYVGFDTWSGVYTIFEDQLDTAFTSAGAFGEFISGLLVHFANERSQWREEMARNALCNFAAGKNNLNNGIINALSEYNTATGLTLTATTVRQPANFGPFCKWLYARVGEISDMMTERSNLYQLNITGYDIFRHTPVRDQKIYIDANLRKHMEAEVLADTYHDNYLAIADVESVNYWQSIQSPNSIDVTPAIIDNTGAIDTGTRQQMSNVVAMLFDRDAVAINVAESHIDMTPFNARGRYWNLISMERIQYQNDFTEKGVVITLN